MITDFKNAVHELEMTRDDLAAGRRGWHFGTMIAHLRNIKCKLRGTMQRDRIYKAAARVPDLPKRKLKSKTATVTTVTSPLSKKARFKKGARAASSKDKGDTVPASSFAAKLRKRKAAARSQDGDTDAKFDTSASEKRSGPASVQQEWQPTLATEEILDWGTRICFNKPTALASSPAKSSLPPTSSLLAKAQALIAQAPTKKIQGSKTNRGAAGKGKGRDH